MKRKVFIILLILWTAFIFFNSLKSAPESIEQSSVIKETVSNIIIKLYDETPPSSVEKYIELDLMDDVRSFAHIFEFFILYILAFLFFSKRGFCSYKLLLKALYYSLIVAIIDESIQIFVPGRGMQVVDLMKDIIGCFIAIIIIFSINSIRKKKCAV